MRVVLTGAPGTAKSAILLGLAERGWTVFPEVFRWRAIVLGLNGKEAAVRAGDMDVLGLQAFLDDACLPQGVDVCCDRCAIDLVAYQRFFGTQDGGPLLMRLAHEAAMRLDVAFYSPLDPARYRHDSLRNESPELARQVGDCVLSTYTEFGIAPQSLAAYSVGDRVDELCSRVEHLRRSGKCRHAR